MSSNIFSNAQPFFRITKRGVPFLLVMFPLGILSILYIKRTFVDVVYLDGFINITIIGQLFNGYPIETGEFFQAWYEEHFNLGYWLYNIMNAWLFNLDMRLDPILCIFAYLFTALLIYIDSIKILSKNNNLVICLFFTPLAFLSFALVAPPLMLMTTQFIWGTAIGLLIAFLIQKLYDSETEKTSSNWLVNFLVVILIPVYFLFFSEGYFLGMITGVFGIYLLKAWVIRKWIEKRIYYWFRSSSCEVIIAF